MKVCFKYYKIRPQHKVSFSYVWFMFRASIWCYFKNEVLLIEESGENNIDDPISRTDLLAHLDNYYELHHDDGDEVENIINTVMGMRSLK